MHLLIILLQQLLGMLPGSKKVPQPEVVRKSSANPNAGEPDACGRIVPSLCGWMTPFERFLSLDSCCANGPRLTLAACSAAGRPLGPFARVRMSIWGISVAALRAHPSSPAASQRRPRP
jgi:hypothetical protein